MSGLFLATILVLWAFGSVTLQPWAWAALGFLVLWNVQFLSLAVLGEYVVRTHRHTQRRPLYVLDAVIERGRAVLPRMEDGGSRIEDRESRIENRMRTELADWVVNGAEKP